MSAPIISVIMLTYNREQLVSRAIESILNQTFSNFEFILVDNGSSDNSGFICDDYAGKDNRIKVIHKENGNIGSGRNAGLDAAQGKYVTFIDDDDWCEPDYFEFLYNLILINNADISICGSCYQFEDGNIKSKYVFDDLFHFNTEEAVMQLLLRNYYNSSNPAKLFKSHLFKNIRYPIHGKYDDISIIYKIFAISHLTNVQGRAKYYFTRHENNNSIPAIKHQFLDPQQLNEYLSAFKERTEYLSKTLPCLSRLAKWSEWSYMISMVEKIKRHNHKNCNEQLEYMINELRQNQNEFLSSSWTQDFEKKWMEKYVNF